MSADLPKTSKQLEAEQAAWDAGKQTREHQLREFDIALDAMGPKVEKARQLLEETKASVEELTELKRTLTAEVEVLSLRKADVATDLLSIQTDLGTLEDIASRKRAEIDADMEAYARGKRTEYNDTLADTQKLIKDAQRRLSTIEADTHEFQSRLDSARQLRVAQRTTAEAQLAEIVAEVDKLTKAKLSYQAEVETQKTKLKRVLVERDEAVATRDKAKIEHDNFVKYETQARDILDTKDRELQQKAANLTTDERRLKAKRSFLAELN